MITLDLIKRWWQSHGFGIESKTDFTFLHDIIRERLPYYAYDTMLRDHPHATAADHRTAQLLFRLANHCQPISVTLYGDDDALAADALRHACPHAVLTHADGPYIQLPTLSVSGKVSQGYAAVLCGEANHPTPSPTAIMVTDIRHGTAALWQQLLRAPLITYDMRTVGIALFAKKRYPEHYFLTL